MTVRELVLYLLGLPTDLTPKLKAEIDAEVRREIRRQRDARDIRPS